MTKKPKLTMKQAKFVEGIAKGKTQAEAYIEAYDTKGHLPTVEAEASKTTKLPQVKEALEKALAKHQITVDRAVKPISDGLDATRTIGFGDDAIETIDHSTRLKASGMALKLLGAEQEKSNGNNFIQVNNNYGDKYSD